MEAAARSRSSSSVGQCGADAGVVRHPSVLERHVQIGANEDAAAFDLRVAHGARVPHSSIGIEL